MNRTRPETLSAPITAELPHLRCRIEASSFLDEPLRVLSASYCMQSHLLQQSLTPDRTLQMVLHQPLFVRTPIQTWHEGQVQAVQTLPNAAGF